MANILDADKLADALSEKFNLLLAEREALRSELARKSSGSIEHDKAFVMAYQNSIADCYSAAVYASRLEHLLLLS